MVMEFLRFGQFLRKKGLISFDDIYKARVFQKQTNLRLGELAREKKWLSDDDIEKILLFQEETMERFGEVAIRQRYLTAEQVASLVDRQAEDEYLFFGEALVKLGLLAEDDMVRNLKEYNQQKFTGVQ
jgi:hypothetical protein